MRTAGFTAEFNPFHNGHAFLVEKLRGEGYTHIVSVMSGNFVQRGEPALFPAAQRVETALERGVDLVIELPVTYAVSGAETFAKAGVSLLDATGVVDTLGFGAECGSLDKLYDAVNALEREETDALIREKLSTGITYAAAREQAVAETDTEAAAVIREPNNILAVEYLKALRSINSGMKPFAVGRAGVPHDSDEIRGGFASASAIRRMLREGEDASPYLGYEPPKDGNGKVLMFDREKYEAVMMYKMKSLAHGEAAEWPDISEGLENRIEAAAAGAASLDELYGLIKTKRYTLSRIKRILLAGALGIKADECRRPVPYIRVLGFGERGAELLRQMRETAKLPVITKAADAAALGAEGRKLLETEFRAWDIHSLIFDKNCSPGSGKDYKIIKKSQSDSPKF